MPTNQPATVKVTSMPTPDTSRATFDSLLHAYDIAGARDLTWGSTHRSAQVAAEIVALMVIVQQEALWEDIDRGTYLTPAQVGVRMAVAKAHGEALLERLDRMSLAELLIENREYTRRITDYLLTTEFIDAKHSEALQLNAILSGTAEQDCYECGVTYPYVVLDDDVCPSCVAGPYVVDLSKPTDRNPSYCAGDGVPTDTGTYFTGDYRWMVRNLRDNVHSTLSMLVRP